MSDETQEVVESVDSLLQDALKHANTTMSHGEVRPSTKMAFDKVEEARLELDRIDDLEFSEDGDE